MYSQELVLMQNVDAELTVPDLINCDFFWRSNCSDLDYLTLIYLCFNFFWCKWKCCSSLIFCHWCHLVFLHWILLSLQVFCGKLSFRSVVSVFCWPKPSLSASNFSQQLKKPHTLKTLSHPEFALLWSLCCDKAQSCF